MSRLGKPRQFPRAPLVRVHHRRHDDSLDVRHALQDGHQALTSAGTTALKSVQSYALRPIRDSREREKAVASGGEQLQQLNQPTLCYGSAHLIEFLCRHRRQSLRLSPFSSSRTPDTD